MFQCYSLTYFLSEPPPRGDAGHAVGMIADSRCDFGGQAIAFHFCRAFDPITFAETVAP